MLPGEALEFACQPESDVPAAKFQLGRSARRVGIEPADMREKAGSAGKVAPSFHTFRK